MDSGRIKKIVGMSLMIIIGFIHVLRIGNLLHGVARTFYTSYFSDFILPFGMYFLLCSAEENHPVLRKWFVKAGLIIGVTGGAEFLQFFGIYALGKSFDPFDFLMYFSGVGCALVIEKFFLKRLFPSWDTVGTTDI